MVNSWLPDPPNENPLNELQSTNENIVIAATDTSEDEDEHQYDGYEPLPLAPGESLEEESSDDDTIEEEPTSSLPPIVPIEKTLIKEVWNTSTPNNIEMNKEKAEEVRLAMANFTLPSSSIPEWAANIPEDQWKQKLIDRIQNKNTHK